ncbi:MAG: hypothetical protein JXR76_26470 [Deltaproteobacteria bacterium]|nr:hypothetical protein [Deltaproteobacteria bacterium]
MDGINGINATPLRTQLFAIANPVKVNRSIVSVCARRNSTAAQIGDQFAPFASVLYPPSKCEFIPEPECPVTSAITSVLNNLHQLRHVPACGKLL